MLRRTLDLTLDVRTEPSGRLVCYWMPTRIGAYADFLDSQPSVLISAWDYVEATGDMDWLKGRIVQLELVASYLRPATLTAMAWLKRCRVATTGR